MNWRILGTREAREWHAVLKCFPRTDVYFLPEYHRAYELNGDGKAYAFVAEKGDRVWFYPFFVRPINRTGSGYTDECWYDIETVYGYSGPLGTTTDEGFLAEVGSVFGMWCRDNRIVAEFARFNPLVGNSRYVDNSCRVVLDRETVVIRLDCSEEELWNNYPSVQRNMVRKSMKRGLVCEDISPNDGGAIFRSLYKVTMDRIGASRYYFFSDQHFEHLYKALEPNLRLFIVRDRDRAIAAALFLLHGDQVHYHLAGSDLSQRGVASNNLLIHTAAQWARERSFHWLHLGGGRTTSPDDSLYRFKASLSRLRLPFHIGMRVHNPEVYEWLCSEWMHRNGVEDRPNYFLLYRLEDN